MGVVGLKLEWLLTESWQIWRAQFPNILQYQYKGVKRIEYFLDLACKLGKKNFMSTINSPKSAALAVMLVVGNHRRFSYSFNNLAKSGLEDGSLLSSGCSTCELYSSILDANEQELRESSCRTQ